MPALPLLQNAGGSVPLALPTVKLSIVLTSKEKYLKEFLCLLKSALGAWDHHIDN